MGKLHLSRLSAYQPKAEVGRGGAGGGAGPCKYWWAAGFCRDGELLQPLAVL